MLSLPTRRSIDRIASHDSSLAGARASGGHRAVTVTAVAVTAVVATAAYMWWRRHDVTRIEPRLRHTPWPDMRELSAVATGPAGVETPASLESADLEIAAKPDDAAPAAVEVAPTIESSDEIETLQGAPQAEVTDGEDETPAGESAVEETSTVSEAVLQDTLAEPPANATASSKPAASASEIEAPLDELTEPDDDAAPEPQPAAEDHREPASSQPAPQGVPKPAVRGGIDSWSDGRPRQASGRMAPRAPFQPLTQRFPVPSPRPRLPGPPGSHRPPLP
jgi:hypothetical protein